MSATRAIPLDSIPSRVNSPRRLPDTSSSATSGSAVTSPQSPNGSQAVRQVKQVSLTDSKGKTLCTQLHVCASWIRSHPLLSIGGLIIALVTLFLGYYQARAANILTSEGNRLAGTALDYTRYQTWCQNLDKVSNYTWCQQHQTPDTFDSAFKANQRRNLHQPLPLVKRNDQALMDCSNYGFGKAWVKLMAMSLATVFVTYSSVGSCIFLVIIFTHFKRTFSPRWHQHSATALNLLMKLELGIDIEPNSRSPLFKALSLTIPGVAILLYITMNA
ncbi:uncharacterized protein K444DRAFT_620769 [Hyaloscypha bicolor E]|uniref:Uncharacterized protein n=1 Tax=Hyaloscypha bicolor E TaxID=1095630 RepID=A0A2J6SLN3_9HELO|nr:uncharacterized protein K444DRAFT_620769 [Hyaloscypha bicolor E]PMD51683.1 hypothetical protein K444DRAFT_620769 [Hyaloscypha bicolor E]